MIKNFRAALLIAVLALTLLTGCGVQAAGGPRATVPPASQNPQSAPAEAAPQLTAEQAQVIALTHAGFTAEQVSFLRTEPELYDRVPHYDVEFREGRWEYEYEIHAETGEILSFERDD